MTKKQIKIISVAVLTVISLLYGLFSNNSSEGRKVDGKYIRVDKVFDGDSIELRINGKLEQIRFIGIDAPEMNQKPWGRKSKNFLTDIISNSDWQVSIEYDVEKRDKYNRLLAYIWAKDGSMVNEVILRSGYAFLYTFPPNVKYVEKLSAAQKHARNSRLGIWGKNGLKQLPSDYRKEHPKR